MPKFGKASRLRYLLKPLNKAETAFNRWKFERRVRKGKLGEVIIFPYWGYENQDKITIMGRVLENNGLSRFKPEDSTLTNIKAMARRYLSREIHMYTYKLVMGVRNDLYVPMMKDTFI